MSEIKYEDIYYMIKDVAYDQEDPIEAYKKIEKEIIKVEADRDLWKRRCGAAEKAIDEIIKISNGKDKQGRVIIYEEDCPSYRHYQSIKDME